MELVYLWVEDYKNIHRQGFNFSPRFRCEYDPDTNELTIDENEDYIENFFGDNINVTAIVGKNGSGKSSVLGKIYSNYFGDEQPLAIYLVGDTLVYRSSIQPSPTNNTQLALTRDDHPLGKLSIYPYPIASSSIKTMKMRCPPFVYLGSTKMRGSDIDIGKEYNMTETRFFIPRYINAYMKKREIFQQLEPVYNFDHLRLVLKDNSTRFLEEYLDKEFTKHKVLDEYEMYNGHKITVCADADMSREKIIEIVKNMLEGEGKLLVDSSETDKIVDDARLFTTDELDYDKNRKKILGKLQKLERIHRAQWNNPYLQNTDKYHEFDLAVVIAIIEYWIKGTQPCKSEGSQIIFDALSWLIEDKFSIYVSENENGEYQILKSYILDFLKHLKEANLEHLSENLTIDEIVNSIEFIKQYANYGDDDIFRKDGCSCVDIPINDDFEANIDKIALLQKVFEDGDLVMAKKETRLRVFELDLFNSKVGSTYSTISDGERQFIHFASDMIFYLSDFEYCQTDTEKALIYLMDEPDNSLHPIWKKQLIDHAVSVCSTISASCTNTSVQLIFTTHSPFLLSDIPKQNIIFLDTDEEGSCKVVDGLKEKKETFGANIHTLLSDSFFMSDGLMGEFAKSKIDKAFELLNKQVLEKEEVGYSEQIIAITGEPILKTQMQKMLDSKRLQKIDKVEELERQIEALTAQVEELKKQ